MSTSEGLMDYTYMWWAYGFRGRSPERKRVLCVSSEKYTAAFDVEKAAMTHFLNTETYQGPKEALCDTSKDLLQSPSLETIWEMGCNGNKYKCRFSKAEAYDEKTIKYLSLPLTLLSDAIPGEQTYLVESGRFVQRFYMKELYFQDNEDRTIPVDARVEVTALPDFLSVMLEIEGQEAMKGFSTGLRFFNKDEAAITEDKESHFVKWMGCSLYIPEQASQAGLLFDENTNDFYIKTPEKNLFPGKKLTVTFFVIPSEDLTRETAENLVKPVEACQIQAMGYSDETLIPVNYDEIHGWYYLPLPNTMAIWDMEKEQDKLERISFSIKNPSTQSIKVPLLFAKDYALNGITGLTPIIRDKEGYPTGLPVQISKNWHTTEGKTYLYQGPWFHGFTMVDVAPEETIELELTIAYAHWGGVPAASHAQLCLIGYGIHQLWDQAAIGSYGESICYDVDVNLGRSMIDDVRPLMVTSMSKQNPKWNWTNNVGGGDFLVYYNQKGQKQFLTGMKTFYENYGPNLTKVHYAGISADEAISAHIIVSTPRCQDMNRAYHFVRYEVLKQVDFKRLAFYQLGSDGYNNHQFNKIAVGNEEGLIKEWQPQKGGLKYEIQGVNIEGQQPWFSLHEAEPWLYYERKIETQGAWANRGLVVRSWKACLNGVDVNTPSYSVYLTEDQIGSANLELSAPKQVSTLLPGDFVEFLVELLIPPMAAEDYYGPDADFSSSLIEEANTWKIIHRQAKKNHIRLLTHQGSCLQSYPPIIKANENSEAEVEIFGGMGYLPITFTGLDSYREGSLEFYKEGGWQKVDQSVHGNDYWQTDFDAETSKWSRTYNIEICKVQNMDGITCLRVVKKHVRHAKLMRNPITSLEQN